MIIIFSARIYSQFYVYENIVYNSWAFVHKFCYFIA